MKIKLNQHESLNWIQNFNNEKSEISNVKCFVCKHIIAMLLEDTITKYNYVNRVMMRSMLNYDLKTYFLLQLGEP